MCLGFYSGGALGFDDARADQESEPALRFTFIYLGPVFFFVIIFSTRRFSFLEILKRNILI